MTGKIHNEVARANMRANRRANKQIHHFYNAETEQSVFGKYKYLKWESSRLFGLSDRSIKDLKLGYQHNIRGWTYLGIAILI